MMARPRALLALICVVLSFSVECLAFAPSLTLPVRAQRRVDTAHSRICAQAPQTAEPIVALHALTVNSVPAGHTFPAHLLLAETPLDGVKGYLLSHPLQDAVGIIILVFTIEFIKQGASLPTAIVAACLQLLNRIPGFTMIGQKPLLKLAISIGIDIVGVASFLLPLVGEVGDLGWAPTSAILVKALYNSNVLATVGLLEEVLPGADIVPTATIGWVFEYVPGVSQLGWVSGMAIPPKSGGKK